MNMKKKFKDTKVGKLLKPVGRIARRVMLGATGGTLKPLLGAAVGLTEGIKSEIISNVNSKDGGEGQVDWVRIIAMVGTLVLMALLVFGKIDISTFESLVEHLQDF